jgi:hypothetical protein
VPLQFCTIVPPSNEKLSWAKRVKPSHEAPVCVAEVDAREGYTFPEELEVEEFPGLLLAGIVRPTNAASRKAKVIAYWENQDFYQAHGAEFWNAVGLTSGFAGLQAASIQRRESTLKKLWNPLGWAALLGWTATLVSNYGSIEKFWNEQWTIPECGLVTDNDPVKCVIGRVTPVKIEWHNDSEIDGIVTLADCKSVSPDAVAHLTQLEKGPLSVKALARQQTTVHILVKKPGTYRMQLLGRVAGRRRGMPLRHQSLRIDAFAPERITKEKWEAISEGTQCLITGRIELGNARKAGSAWYASVVEPTDVFFEPVLRVPELSSLITPRVRIAGERSPADRQIRADWRLPATEAFSRYHFRILLTSKVQRLNQFWENIYHTLEIDSAPEP